MQGPSCSQVWLTLLACTQIRSPCSLLALFNSTTSSSHTNSYYCTLRGRALVLVSSDRHMLYQFLPSTAQGATPRRCFRRGRAPTIVLSTVALSCVSLLRDTCCVTFPHFEVQIAASRCCVRRERASTIALPAGALSCLSPRIDTCCMDFSSITVQAATPQRGLNRGRSERIRGRPTFRPPLPVLPAPFTTPKDACLRTANSKFLCPTSWA